MDYFTFPNTWLSGGDTSLTSIRESYLYWKNQYIQAKDRMNKGIVNIYDENYGFLLKQYDPEKDPMNQKAEMIFHLYADLMKKYNIVPYPDIKPEHQPTKKENLESKKRKQK